MDRINNISEKLIYILLALLILCLLILGVMGTFFHDSKIDSPRILFSEYLMLESERNEGAFLDLTGDDENVVIYNGGQLPSSSDFDNKMYTFKTYFKLPSGENEMDWSLYTGLFEYPYRIYLNGYEISRKGRYNDGNYNSSLRTAGSVYLSPNLLKENQTNELVLQIYPEYETWALDLLYIGTRAQVSKAVFIRNFIGVHLLQGAFVLSFATGLYFAALFLIIRDNTKKYLYFSFFSFFFCLVYLNLVTHFESINEIIMESISKASMIPISTALLFFIKEYTQTLCKRKFFWRLMFTAGLTGFILVFIQKDKESLLAVFSIFLNFLIIPQTITGFIMILYYGIKKRGHFFWPILVSFTIIFITMLHDAYYFFSMTLPYAWMMTYGFLAMEVAIFVSLVEEQSRIYLTSIQQAKDLEEKQEKNEKLNQELVLLNNNLETVVEEKTRDLKKTIELLNYEIDEREKMSEQLRHQASTDAMTGIMNRSYGISYLENQMALVKRRKGCLAVCFIDLNDLKKVNDTLGHKAGDDYIISTARIISYGLRKSDVLCRLGGDEFMVVFSETSVYEAASIMLRVDELIKNFNMEKEKQFEVSISFGLSEYNTPWNKNKQELIEEADRKMYEAKKEYKKKLL